MGVAGHEWQEEKVRELKQIFGSSRIHENSERNATGPKPLALKDLLPNVEPYQFIVEGTYEVDTWTFRKAVGLTSLTDFYGDELDLADARPDIIQVLPPLKYGGALESDREPNPFELAVKPNGDLTVLPQDDLRLRLRVIDIKLTSEPGANYFAEVVYYSMTLAAWLEEMGLSRQLVVVGAPAVWPGKHEASNLALQLREWNQTAYSYTDKDLIDALEEDVEIAVFDVFAPRLRQLLTDDLPRLLSQPWDRLTWHVDFRCKGCEFLYVTETRPDKNAPLRCYPTAEQFEDLSRVYGLSRGASEQLRQRNVTKVSDLATTQATSILFESHQSLKAKRTAFPYRAHSLVSGTTSIIPDSGGDALMPKWPDLRIFLFLDYDLSSAITASMAIRAFWREPLPISSPFEPKTLQWSQRTGYQEVFIVDARLLDREREEFLKFLRQLAAILEEVVQQDNQDVEAGRRDRRTKHSKYQIYLWDEAQKKHLVRLIGRHLSHILQDPKLKELVWLFPPPEILSVETEATRMSALTLVKVVVENTVALDVPHYYDLLNLAERVKPADHSMPVVHDLFREPFSDLIPMERIHEYWTRKGNWPRTQNRILETTRAKALALNYVASWLQKELRDVLSDLAAPPLTNLESRFTGTIPPISKVWLGFTELNAALESLDKHTTRAMPPHERAARLKSARLVERLEGNARAAAIEALNASDGINLPSCSSLFVYRLHSDSVDVNIQPGDFLYALVPESEHGFLDRNAYSITVTRGFEQPWYASQTAEQAGLTSVTVKALDRLNGLIALQVDKPRLIATWEQNGDFDFSRNVMLDPVHRDFLTKKVSLTLKGIGHPPSAPSDQKFADALGITKIVRRKTSETAASQILWNAQRVSQEATNIDLTRLRSDLAASLLQQQTSLDESQWRAWERSLTRRLSLIWGPPGTGKSRTLRAIILSAVLASPQREQPLRILVTANTYTAIDNVLFPLERELTLLTEPGDWSLYRIQSKWQELPPASWSTDDPHLVNLVLNRRQPSFEVLDLLDSLKQPETPVIVGCTPQQLHNLAITGVIQERPHDTLKEWFDFIVIDEASQIDVATSTLVFSKRAANGICILAGDEKQLPPIHQAEPPTDLEHAVGSVYSYFRYFHDIDPVSLDINYRSNKTIVDFTKMAGYSEHLRSYSPELVLNYTAPIGNVEPEGWPDDLFWTAEWGKLLDPHYPAISFVYSDVLSTQVNEFEADAIASLVWLLKGRLAQRDGTPNSIENFWKHAVGIVTPHRAQRSKVINRLRQILPSDPAEEIFGAVDTVERYQGQERDIIIASFGIGDPDLIQAEDEFLFNLNRFNVLISRARAKVIVFCTQSLLQHLSEDIKVLDESRLLKGFAEAFCHDPEQIVLGYYSTSGWIERQGLLRRRGL